jgi:glycerol kinase
VEAMENDAGTRLSVLRVDGGMVENELLMQCQADLLNRTVIKSSIKETTALGAAYVAGLATGFFKDLNHLCALWVPDRTWMPSLEPQKREEMYRMWKKAITRSFDWID